MKAVCNKKSCVLALGAESVGIFAVYKNGNIFISDNFGDLLEESNFLKYKKAVLSHLRKEKIMPNVILTDLHPLYKTTIFGEELAKKYKAPHIKVQHHIAHIFSAIGDFLQNTKYKIPNTFYGITMDGTGYGSDGNIWGGEVFKFQMPNSKCQTIKIIRIGSLEEQTMIGGDLTVREPARMLVAILAKLKAQNSKLKTTTQNSKIIKPKKDIYKFVKKFYTWNEFELLYNQLEQGFNCQTTTSTGRVLDAASVLLGFTGNERKYKHEATKLLEAKSTVQYDNLDLRFKFYDLRKILDTTYLFEYLIKNIHKDKQRLAATAQLYIAKGLYQIVKNNPNTKYKIPNTIFAAGGLSNNKIISEYLEKKGVHLSKEIPRGDEGIAVGQIAFYLQNNGNQKMITSIMQADSLHFL